MGKNTAKARELIRREADLIKNWLRLTGFEFKDEPAGHEALREHIRAHLKRAFGAQGSLTGADRP